MNFYTHRARTCNEVGICQRIGTECQRECHQAPAWQGEPPIGYEAARTADLHQLHRDTKPARAAEIPTPTAYGWDWLTRLAAKASLYFMASLLALALVGWLLTTVRSWATCAGSGWLADMCWTIYNLHG